jgi:hypothetical protein
VTVDGLTGLHHVRVHFAVDDPKDHYGLVQRYVSGYVAAEVNNSGHAVNAA